MTLAGTPESRSYTVILVLRLYLLRPRAVAQAHRATHVGLTSWWREVKEKGSNDAICADGFDMLY